MFSESSNPGWSEIAGLRWRVCEPFGAEIDCDLSAPLPEGVAVRLAELLAEQGLLIAHDQSLDRLQHQELMENFGPIIAHREGDTGFMRSEGGDGPGTSKLSWHADTAYTETPFEALSLHALDVIAARSSTRFVNVEQALDRLPQELHTLLEAHDADMMSSGVEKLAVRLCNIPHHPNPGYRARLPSIRVNQRTGRRYVGVSEMQTAALHGMSWEESRTVLNAVFDQLYAPACIHEHFWKNGDLLVWDNLACQHGRGWLNDVGRRVLQRVIVGRQSFAVRSSGKSVAMRA